ncbi:DUF2294 family protein [Rossellomorea vietnamensis]|uniref:DUF2294 family protein n=1 Tax=Rossellomorea vietnamensis TaxID=218284 RepID=A0A5D4M918_9BACI|nr:MULTISPECIES: Na-translocating system protein MpsC family protein [Bacillaceae]TYR98031.1 DUF2294 family protein [Rossellomorea vietnamensis]
MVKTNLEKTISSYIGRLLREHFGRGPGNVLCTVTGPYVVTQFSDFLSPMEQSLMDSDQTVYVEKTRDLMMETLTKEITSFIELNTEGRVAEFYYDWNLTDKTGMMIAILSSDVKEHSLPQINNYKNSDALIQDINQITTDVQKPPEETYSIMQNPRTLLIIRKGIFILLEKELIRLGYHETLRIAKRNLEKRMLFQYKERFEKHLGAELKGIFVDWDFDGDKSCILLHLNPSQKSL